MQRILKGKFLKIKYFYFKLLILLILVSRCSILKLEPQQDTSIRDTLFLASIIDRCDTIPSCFQRFARTSDRGAALLVVDKENQILYKLEKGNIAHDKHQMIFSGSKLITAVVIQRLIQRNINPCNLKKGGGTFSPPLNLNTTTGDVFGWTNRGNVTLRQLLAFTSGFNFQRQGFQDACIANLPVNASDEDKDRCVESIRDNTVNQNPGEFFHYNSNHMAIAQRMVEVACGSSWANLYRDEVAIPLGFDVSKTFWAGNFTLDGQPKSDGSLAGAYGLVISPEEYSRIMLALLRDGNGFNGISDVPGYLQPSKVQEILADQSEGAKIGYSQFAAFGYQWRYGLGNWRYCSVPENPSKCEEDLVSHSIGINGFLPWLDRNRGYFGIIAVDNLGRKAGIPILPPPGNSLFFMETIRPKIHKELNQ